jgi:hypothetical protein
MNQRFRLRLIRALLRNDELLPRGTVVEADVTSTLALIRSGRAELADPNDQKRLAHARLNGSH